MNSLQEIWDYVKRPNLCLIGLPECDGENEYKLENTLQDIIQKNFPNVARQAIIQVQEIQRTPQRYSSRIATPKDTHRLKIKGWRKIYQANGEQKKAGVAILYLIK